MQQFLATGPVTSVLPGSPADPGLWQRLLEGGRRQNNASTRLPRSAQHTLRQESPFRANRVSFSWNEERRKRNNKKKRALFGKEK